MGSARHSECPVIAITLLISARHVVLAATRFHPTVPIFCPSEKVIRAALLALKDNYRGIRKIITSGWLLMHSNGIWGYRDLISVHDRADIRNLLSVNYFDGGGLPRASASLFFWCRGQDQSCVVGGILKKPLWWWDISEAVHKDICN